MGGGLIKKGADMKMICPAFLVSKLPVEPLRGHSVWRLLLAVLMPVLAAVAPQPPLAEALPLVIARSEKAAAAAGFPRRSILNAVLKSMWEALYRSGADTATQTAALAAISAEGLSPIGREAVARMNAEMALN